LLDDQSTPMAAAPSDGRDVPMIRVAAATAAEESGPERQSATIEAFGRDVQAVFPTAAKRAAADAALEASARLRAATGAHRFVKGETVLIGDGHEAEAAAAAAAAAAAPPGRGDEGVPYTSKSLAEQLQERKEARELEKDEARRAGERGGRLDADEVEFLQRVRDAEEAAERRRMAEEADGVADFRRAVEEEAERKRRREAEEGDELAAASSSAAAAGAATAAAAGGAAAAAAAAGLEGGPGKRRAATRRRGPRMPALVVVRPDKKALNVPAAAAGAAAADVATAPASTVAAAAVATAPASTAAAAAVPVAPAAPAPLGGLLGDYGSSSSDAEEENG